MYESFESVKFWTDSIAYHRFSYSCFISIKGMRAERWTTIYGNQGGWLYDGPRWIPENSIRDPGHDLNELRAEGDTSPGRA